jgi:hypothetical protein
MDDCPNGRIKKRELNNTEKCVPLSPFSNTKPIQIVVDVNPVFCGKKSVNEFLSSSRRKTKRKRKA